jgi:hypothetical protein
LLADREVALRLAVNRDLDRKLRIASGSRFFWVYSLSLWDPDAFWKCISGASAFAFMWLILERLVPGGFASAPLTATAFFECFLFGLILMWVYSLGPWLHPTNLTVIFTFIFRLYRKNKTLDDLSPQELYHLFPEKGDPVSIPYGQVVLWTLFNRVRRSPVLMSLMLGASFAALLVALLLVAA